MTSIRSNVFQLCQACFGICQGSMIVATFSALESFLLKMDNLMFHNLIWYIFQNQGHLILVEVNFAIVVKKYPEIHQLKNVNFTQVYDELTYQPIVDYQVDVESSEVNFKTDDIYTFSHGKCQKFQPTMEIEAQMKVILINAKYIGSKSDAPSSK